VRYAWIHEHRGGFELQRLCRLLQVSRSGYYAWNQKRCKPGALVLRRKELLDQIRIQHELGRKLYGSPRVHAALVDRGIQVCVNTVARLMKQAGIRAKTTRRFCPMTTESKHAYKPAANLLDRQFQAPLPNQKWLCDITYLPTQEGHLYLASVLDVCSRRIVGWSMAEHLRAELCMEALKMALGRRRPGRKLLHHSDRGVQYACDAYQQLLEDHHLTCSMSRAGNCYDNAMMESFHGTLKNELVYREPKGRFESIEQARRMVFEYIEVFYNRQRRHSAIGYMSPEQFEASLN
jgi:putative transposase